MNISFLQLIKFGIVGALNTVVYYIFYSSLVYIKVPYIGANIIAFFISIINSYFWNNRYVFKKQENEKRNLWSTFFKSLIAYAVTWLVISNILLALFVEVFHVSKYIAPGFVLFVTIPSNFIINKYWAFKTKKDK